MKSVNEQFAEMQKKTLESLEPVKNMNAVAAEAFERIARKNYDLMGDLVDYAVAQIKTPANAKNLQEAYEQRVAETKAFAEKVNARAAEYVALAGELGEMAKSKAPAAPKAKASSAADTAKAASAPAKATPAKAESAPAKAASAPAKATPAKAESAPAKAASAPAKATPAKTAPATAKKAASAPARATSKTESKAAPAAAKKKASAKKTAAKSG